MPCFYAKVPIVGGEEQNMPFLLPHLILHKMTQKGDNWKQFKPGSEDVHIMQAMRETGKELHTDVESAIPLGFHGDGTPYGRSK